MTGPIPVQSGVGPFSLRDVDWLWRLVDRGGLPLSQGEHSQGTADCGQRVVPGFAILKVESILANSAGGGTVSSIVWWRGGPGLGGTVRGLL